MKKYDIAAYVWPAYTGKELRSRMFWQEGNGEWQSVRTAMPKFEGHQWPRKPLWGYVDEADPKVMEMQIEQATKHGVNVFIYDWYWYDGRPFLEDCLNDGFLKAKNNDKMKFYLMWANHDANHIWNKELSDTECADTVIWKGIVNKQEFEKLSRRVCDKYFSLDNYYKIDGCPVFMIYDIGNFLAGFANEEEAKAALDKFRVYVKEKGFPNVHIQFTARGKSVPNMSGVDGTDKAQEDFDRLLQRFCNSFTYYQFVHMTDIDRDYNDIMVDVENYWEKLENRAELLHFHHISCGWDNNPRFKAFRPGIMKNNTPENFEKALRIAKKYMDLHPEKTPLLTINSWNEWTESSYLQPDDLYGYGYLEAIKKVFLDE